MNNINFKNVMKAAININDAHTSMISNVETLYDIKYTVFVFVVIGLHINTYFDVEAYSCL